MKITNLSTDAAVLSELGARLARARVDRELTQRQLAAEAGIGLATVKRLESGSSVGSDTLLRYLRVVGRLGAIEQLVPVALPRPLEQLEHGADRRQRVRHGHLIQKGHGRWQWADEPEPGG